MRIKTSACFWCGASSDIRVKGPNLVEFNACDPHAHHLQRHARLIFQTAFSYHDRQGKSLRFRWDPTTEAWRMD